MGGCATTGCVDVGYEGARVAHVTTWVFMQEHALDFGTVQQAHTHAHGRDKGKRPRIGIAHVQAVSEHP